MTAPTLDDVKRAASMGIRSESTLEVRQAAVAMVFTGTSRNLDMLLLTRASRASDPWSGHMALPGGKLEPEDPSLRVTAERETHEEVGLELKPDHFLGRLDPALPGGSGKIIVYPFVYYVETLPELTLEPEEVAAAHRVPLTSLARGHQRGSMPYLWKGQNVRLPAYHLAVGRLWGLTLQIVDDLLHRIDGRGVGLARPSVAAATEQPEKR